jgi:hypothetical protein
VSCRSPRGRRSLIAATARVRNFAHCRARLGAAKCADQFIEKEIGHEYSLAHSRSFAHHLCLTVAPAPARARTPTLDGRSFEGVVLERGKTSGDADTLIFKDGQFRSTACDQYGHADGPYTASVSGDTIAFEAETESPKYGKLLWKGAVRGHKLDGTMTMVRDGKAAGEKWVVAGEIN